MVVEATCAAGCVTWRATGSAESRLLRKTDALLNVGISV
jgi:hypothetical protein